MNYKGGDGLTADDELRIIKKVLGGDKGAFEGLVLANQKNVYNLALKMTKNEDDAMDISQEAFFKAYLQLESYRAESRFSVWLYRLTYNLCIDFLRKKPRTAAVSLTYQDDGDDAADIEIPDARELPEDTVLRRETRKAITESIDELDPAHREIVIMREITGMSYSDMAITLNVSEGTVKSRLSRARKNLVNILVNKGTFPESYRLKEREEAEKRG
jgi:RNA polymerase sigma-70 factor (ECF subfamily)